LIAIDVKDPIAEQVNDVPDVEKYFPGLLKASVEWFKIYKIPDGKPENQFAFNGEAKPASFAHKIVDEVLMLFPRANLIYNVLNILLGTSILEVFG
jgi:nucleosome-remodeling factor subunit